MIRLKTNNIRSFIKDSVGVNFKASPKHPQSFTTPNIADAPVRKVKNTIRISKIDDQNETFHLSSRLKPMSISKAQRLMAKNKEVKSKALNPATALYSSSL